MCILESSSQLVLCSVVVIPSTMERTVWPSPKFLVTVISQAGQNCRDACMANKMVSNDL